MYQRIHVDYVLFGAELIDDGREYYPDWCSLMVAEFDDSITADLELFYGVARSVAEYPRDQWSARIAGQLNVELQSEPVVVVAELVDEPSTVGSLDRDSAAERHPAAPTTAELYRRVTPLRRQDVCTKIILAEIAAIFAIGYFPRLFPIGILTTLGVVVVCVMVLTGPIYQRQLDFQQGVLEQWGVGNKIAAVILLVLLLGGIGYLAYRIYD